MRAGFLQQMQQRTAWVSVAPSAVRGPDSAGVMPAARGFLAKADLSVFATNDLRKFSNQLNRQTKSLMAALPPKERHFGLARKVLNLFLRECLYNAYLRQAFDLGVRKLTTEASKVYQARATELAIEAGLDRVHLDLYYWTERD